MFSQMTSQMASLESRLTDVQHQSTRSISKQKAQYESKLKAQRANIRATEIMNSNIKHEIVELKKTNVALRRKADQLVAASNRLKSDLHAMRDNITTVAEFIDKTVDASTSMLENASEVKVLAELAEHDEIQSKELVHQRRL